MQQIAVFPVELVFPDRYAAIVWRQVRDQPVRRPAKLVMAIEGTRAAVEVEVSESPLRDRDRVVLLAHSAAVIEERDPVLVEMSRIVCLAEEAMVVFAAELPERAWVYDRSLVPERELAR